MVGMKNKAPWSLVVCSIVKSLMKTILALVLNAFKELLGQSSGLLSCLADIYIKWHNKYADRV